MEDILCVSVWIWGSWNVRKLSHLTSIYFRVFPAFLPSRHCLRGRLHWLCSKYKWVIWFGMHAPVSFVVNSLQFPTFSYCSFQGTDQLPLAGSVQYPLDTNYDEDESSDLLPSTIVVDSNGIKGPLGYSTDSPASDDLVQTHSAPLRNELLQVFYFLFYLCTW